MTGTRTDTGASTSLGAVAGVTAVLVVVVGVFLVQRGTDAADTGPTGSDPATVEGTTLDESPSDSPSSDDEQAEDEAWVAEAVLAAKDGFPAFVPAEVPAGWAAGEATYEPDTSWQLELTSPSGATVTIDQRSSGTVPTVVGAVVGKADRTGAVNLRRWGTGTWQVFTGSNTVALAQELTGTVVVVWGDTDKDEVVEITKQLLTVEMAVNLGDGSDG